MPLHQSHTILPIMCGLRVLISILRLSLGGKRILCGHTVTPDHLCRSHHQHAFIQQIVIEHLLWARRCLDARNSTGLMKTPAFLELTFFISSWESPGSLTQFFFLDAS